MATPENRTEWEIHTLVNHHDVKRPQLISIIASFLDGPNDATYQAYGLREIFLQHLRDSVQK